MANQHMMLVPEDSIFTLRFTMGAIRLAIVGTVLLAYVGRGGVGASDQADSYLPRNSIHTYYPPAEGEKTVIALPLPSRIHNIVFSNMESHGDHSEWIAVRLHAFISRSRSR